MASYDKALGVVAKGCGLDPKLVRAIILVESSGNLKAIRYEPAFYERYIKKSSYPQAEHRLLASSLGIMQIMGVVARERGFPGPLEQLFIPEVNLVYGCLHLARLQEKYGSMDDVIAAYNSGSVRLRVDGKYVNDGYVTKVKAALQTFAAKKPE